MTHVLSRDPDLMEYKKGGGCLAFFGMPFFLFGFGVMSFAFGGNTHGEPIIFFILFGAIFTLIGMGYIFGRAGVVIDRKMQVVTSWWGLSFFTISRKIYILDKFKQVSITKEIRKNKNSSYTVYPLRLIGDVQVNLEESLNYKDTRKEAEAVAKFLKFNIVDTSSGTEVVREHDKLDESIREQVRRTGNLEEVPPAPENMKIEHLVDGDEMQFDIPAPGWSTLYYVPLVIAAIISMIFYFSTTGDMSKDGPVGVRYLFIAFSFIPLFTVWIALYHSASMKSSIRVSPKELIVTKTWAMGKKITKMSTDDIEEIQIATSGNAETHSAGKSEVDADKMLKDNPLLSTFVKLSILVRTDDASVNFGSSLSMPELKWLVAVIKNVISA